jgi:hypothetical protein
MALIFKLIKRFWLLFGEPNNKARTKNEPKLIKAPKRIENYRKEKVEFYVRFKQFNHFWSQIKAPFL